MRRIFLVFIFSWSLVKFPVFAQAGDSISADMLKKMVSFLASDEMRGRVNFTIQQLNAAAYISSVMKETGLKPLGGYSDFYFPFMLKSASASDSSSLIWNGKIMQEDDYYFLSNSSSKKKLQLENFIVLRVDLPIADSILFNHWETKEPVLLWVNLRPGMKLSGVAANVILPDDDINNDILIAGSPEEPASMIFSGKSSRFEPFLYNLIGVLPGKSKQDELVVFSAHYDHVDFDLSGRITGDIFNGANDDASGTAAVLAMARYYATRNDNQRTLVFCLFAGEELGLYGSQAFVSKFKQLKNIKANINIEMIGKTNVTGNNAFFITGPLLSDLQEIFIRNLRGSDIKLVKSRPDPNNLFQRSDNYNFFLRGIPAHSIMCSDDNEPCYHKTCDDPERIDYDNMARVVKGIIKAVSTIVSGEDTPHLEK